MYGVGLRMQDAGSRAESESTECIGNLLAKFPGPLEISLLIR